MILHWTINIYCAKGDVTVDHNIVTRCFKNFYSGCNLDNQARLDRLQTGNNQKRLLNKSGGGVFDHHTVTRWLKRFCSGCNPNNQARSDKPKSVDSEVMLQAIRANQASSLWRVSGELGILQSRVVCHHNSLGRSIRSCRIVPYTTKILQNLWLTLVDEFNKKLYKFLQQVENLN